MHATLQPAATRDTPGATRVERPWYVWVAVLLEVVTAILAIPVGPLFIADPTGRSMGLPEGWIEATAFGSYLIPGLYLFAVNGLVMLALAVSSALGHWVAPWLTGVLGVGMIVWILVQLAVDAGDDDLAVDLPGRRLHPRVRRPLLAAKDRPAPPLVSPGREPIRG